MKLLSYLLLSMILIVAGCDTTEPVEEQHSDSGIALSKSGLPGKGTVLRLVGTGTAYPGTVPDIDGDGVDDDGTCFDVGLYDAAGNHIGTATDCLSNIQPVGDGLALIGTTTFHMPNGTFTSRGHTSVQPLTTGVPSPATHVTGAIPTDGSNGIIAGTGAYARFEAKVRLSGAVNLSRLGSDDEISFDCLFAIDPY